MQVIDKLSESFAADIRAVCINCVDIYFANVYGSTWWYAVPWKLRRLFDISFIDVTPEIIVLLRYEKCTAIYTIELKLWFKNKQVLIPCWY